MKTVWKSKKIKIGSAALIALEFLAYFLFVQYGYHWIKIIRYLGLIACLVILAVVDLRSRVVPNRVLICMFTIRALLLAGEIVLFSDYWKEVLISAAGGAVTGFLIFLFTYLFARKGIGLGDVKLMGVLGWYLGASLIWWDIVFCMMLAAVYSIIQLLRKKIRLKDSIPMVPFFSVGTILLLLLGF